MFRKKKVNRSFLESLYKQYSPKQNKKDLEEALRNYEKKDVYEKKIIIANLTYLLKANEVDNSHVAYISIFSIFLSSMVLFFKDLINNEMISYSIICILFIYILYTFSKAFTKNKTIKSELEYLLALLEEF